VGGPTVFALDALWVVFQATEVLAGNNGRRAVRVRAAGLFLTAVNAAVPTAELLTRDGSTGADLAVVLTPLAIVATKTAWWVALPALGRRASASTRQRIETRRQEVADRLEEMEADAAHRIELLDVARDLEERVARAETAYRLSVLKTQESMTKRLHSQARATEKTTTTKTLPEAVTAIALPVLEEWRADLPALPGPVGRHTPVTQVSAGISAVPSRETTRTVTLDEVAAVTGVPVPVPGEQLTDDQLSVVLRYLRYSVDPPMSYRQAVRAFRQAGYVGSEQRVRHEWGALMTHEDEASEDDAEEEALDA
jgi:TolA-binding protein